MRKITDFNEFVKVWSVAHNNDDSLSINERNTLNERDFKRFLIYMLDDGVHFLKFDRKHLRCIPILFDGKFRPYYAINFFMDELNMEVFVVDYNDSPTKYQYNLIFFQEMDFFVGFMTDDDINKYNEIVKELKGDE